MLTKDPNKRIELMDVFDHPWINSHKKNEVNYESSGISESEDGDSVSDKEDPGNSRQNSKVMMFNIAENENETTTNCVNVDDRRPTTTNG